MTRPCPLHYWGDRVEDEDAGRTALNNILFDLIMSDDVLLALWRDDDARMREISNLHPANDDAVRTNDDAIAHLSTAVQRYRRCTVVPCASVNRYIRHQD